MTEMEKAGCDRPLGETSGTVETIVVKSTTVKRWGATPEDWKCFVGLGLAADMLPRVCNPHAVKSPHSKLDKPGKVPTQYYAGRMWGGIKDWPTIQTTPAQIKQYMAEGDYGICIVTRKARGLDVDVTDPVLAAKIEKVFRERAPAGKYPKRYRSNSSKFLITFILEGDMPKRVIKCAEHDGKQQIIEFLATGQHYAACGFHNSGVRYEWEGGLPEELTELEPDEFEGLWAALQTEFGVEPATEARDTTPRAIVASQAIDNDPVAQHLIQQDMVLRIDRKTDAMYITCPNSVEHTSDSGETETVYYPANTGGYAYGGFCCKHSHCENIKTPLFKELIGFTEEDTLAGFDNIDAEDVHQPIGAEGRPRFASVPMGEMLAVHYTKWFIKGVLPHAELGMLYGESGAGKSFMALDMTVCIARGVPWRDRKVKQARVAYVVAEGKGGFSPRLRAYATQHCVDLSTVPFHAITDVPNFLTSDDVALARQINADGGADLIVIDTLAQTTPGASENSSDDMGKALAHCRRLATNTGAMVLLIHHAGKDLSRGARGWSGMKAAADVELCVDRPDGANVRLLTVTKLKDGTDYARFPFKLMTVPLGTDPDGDVFESCVIEHSYEAVVVEKKVAGKVQRAVRDVVRDLVGLGGDLPTEESVVTRVVERVQVEMGGPERWDAKARANKAIAVRKAINAMVRDSVLAKIDGCLTVWSAANAET